MASVEQTEANRPSNLSQSQGYSEPVNDQQRSSVRNFSSVEKLPLIRGCKSVSPLPKRKNAVVNSPKLKVKSDRLTPNDLPPLPGYQSSEAKTSEAKRSLSIPVSPTAFRKHDKDGKEGSRKTQQNVNLRPIVPRNRASLQLYPLQKRKFLSALDNSSHLDITREDSSAGKSVSLDDITLESRRGGYDEDDVLESEGQHWSRHWYYTRKSIGAMPREKDFLNLEILSNAFNQRSRTIKSNDFAGDVAMYGSQEPDIMNNDKTLSSTLTLEERLATIEKQQGLSTMT